MIRHIVLMRFRDDVSPLMKSEIYDDLNSLQGKIPGMSGFHAGPNVSPETAVIHGNRDAFWVDFADAAARDAYLADERHQKIGARIASMTVGGLDGISVVDLAF